MRSWSGLVLLTIAALLGYGVWAYTRLPDQPLSGGPTPRERYGTPTPQVKDLLLIEEAVAQAKGNAKFTVTLQGDVVDMGPTMGCWLLIQDGTGEVLVQTGPMVYMPQELRGATVRATGTLVHGRGRGMGYDREGWFLLSPGVEVVKKSS